MPPDDARGAAPPGAPGPPAAEPARGRWVVRLSALVGALRAVIGIPLTGAAYRASARAPASVGVSRPDRRAR